MDIWQPSESDTIDFTLPVNDRRATVRRDDDVENAKRYGELEEKSTQGVCNFCGHATSREFCGSKCETNAALATMGKSIKFHE